MFAVSEKCSVMVNVVKYRRLDGCLLCVVFHLLKAGLLGFDNSEFRNAQRQGGLQIPQFCIFGRLTGKP